MINNDYVADAGLNPKDAIYQDDAESEEARPYINVWVARKTDVNNETYKKLVSIFQQKDVLDALQENSGGTAVFADKFSAKQLQGLPVRHREGRQGPEVKRTIGWFPHRAVVASIRCA